MAGKKNITFLCDSIYIQFQNRQSFLLYIRTVVPLERKADIGGGREGDFWDGNNFVFLNLGSTYITLFCDNSSSCVVITGTLDCICLHFNKNVYFF